MAKFDWVEIYEELADKLLEYKNNRKELLNIAERVIKKQNLEGYNEKDSDRIFNEIDPFTFFGMFNRNLPNEKRIEIIQNLIEEFNLKGVTINKNCQFEGVPVLAVTYWFFAGENNRKEDDVDRLWDLFESALLYTKLPSEENVIKFSDIFDKVVGKKQNSYATRNNVSDGLFWIRPKTFLGLDAKNIEYIQNHGLLNKTDIATQIIKKNNSINTNKISGGVYLKLCQICKEHIMKEFPNTEKGYELCVFSSSAYEENKEKEIKRGIWIFQANPEDFPIEKKVSEKAIIEWEKVTSNGKRIKKDDIVYIWRSGQNRGIIGKAVVNKKKKGDPIQRGKRNFSRFSVFVKVEESYIPDYISYKTFQNSEILKNSRIMKVPNETVYSLSEEELLEIEKIKGDRSLSESLETNDLFEKIYIDDENIERLKSLLTRKKNVILTGAPGVGKTFLAKKIPALLTGKEASDNVEFIQFHQNYGYEDFVEGFKPNKEGGFDKADGIFKKFCNKITPDKDYFFIIDEINRGNLSKIFGELLMLIENDKREDKIQLMYSKEEFSVPKNLYIIGMMNTADRSITSVDYALRRRFGFFNLSPAFENEKFKKVIEEKKSEKLNQVIYKIKETNKEIRKDLGDGFQIGHSYFCKVDAEKELKDIIDFEICPLIDEYYFDSEDKAERFKKDLRGIFDAN